MLIKPQVGKGLGRFAAQLLNVEMGYQYQSIISEHYGVHL